MLFISHSAKDKEQALDLVERLLQRGYKSEQVFLDSDRKAGISPGRDWRKEIYLALRKCSALIVLYSKNWRESEWCTCELGFAKAKGKDIFPVLLENCEFRGTPAAEHQAISIDTGWDVAVDALCEALDSKHVRDRVAKRKNLVVGSIMLLLSIITALLSYGMYTRAQLDEERERVALLHELAARQRIEAATEREQAATEREQAFKKATEDAKRIARSSTLLGQLLQFFDPLDLDDPTNWGIVRREKPSLDVGLRLHEARSFANELNDLPQDKIELLVAIGRTYRSNGMYDQAQEVLNEAKSLVQTRITTASGTVSQVRLLIEDGQLQRESTNYGAAVKSLEEAVTLAVSLSAVERASLLDTAEFHLAWALAARAGTEDSSTWNSAVDKFDEVTKARRSLYGPNSTQCKIAEAGLGFALLGRGQEADEAEAFGWLARAVDTLDLNTGKQLPSASKALAAYVGAKLRLKKGEGGKAAEDALRDVLNFMRQRFGEQHPWTALLMGEFAGFLRNNPQNLKEARELIDKAITIGDQHPMARKHPKLIEALVTYGDFLRDSDIQSAKSQYEKALKYAEMRRSLSDEAEKTIIGIKSKLKSLELQN